MVFELQICTEYDRSNIHVELAKNLAICRHFSTELINYLIYLLWALLLPACRNCRCFVNGLVYISGIANAFFHSEDYEYITQHINTWRMRYWRVLANIGLYSHDTCLRLVPLVSVVSGTLTTRISRYTVNCHSPPCKADSSLRRKLVIDWSRAVTLCKANSRSWSPGRCNFFLFHYNCLNNNYFIFKKIPISYHIAIQHINVYRYQKVAWRFLDMYY